MAPALICVNVQDKVEELVQNLKAKFFGDLIQQDQQVLETAQFSDVFFCGDVGKLSELNIPAAKVKIVKEVSHNYENREIAGSFVTLGEVPVDIHGVGVYFERMFSFETDYFDKVNEAHQFQVLTESNKESPSFRKGLYLSNVETLENGDTAFNLLRCSTNLKGPTDNLKAVDREIIDKVNNAASTCFSDISKLNHVLAQIYENKVSVDGGSKEKKARIKSHSDKTKDMPENGLIAFCTFYSSDLHDKAKITNDDFVYKHGSVLTRLRFRLKQSEGANKDLVEKFEVTLLPNSVLLIPLSTNRLYTHEIVPSGLPVERIPTRLGYVIRCSNTKAVHKDGSTYVQGKEGLVKLTPPTADDITRLRELYFLENSTDDKIDYGDVFFSMNDGDYMQPSK